MSNATPPAPRAHPPGLSSAVVLGTLSTALLAGILVYVSPAVTPERFAIWSLPGIAILLLVTPVSAVSLLATAYPVVRAIRIRARRSRSLGVLWLGTAALTATAAVLMYVP